MGLRERAVASVEEEYPHRAAAARFRVSVRFVNDMVILKRETGGLEPRRKGNRGGHGRLGPLHDWIAAWMATMPALTPDDLVLVIAQQHQLTVQHHAAERSDRTLTLLQLRPCISATETA
jgi:transposase